MNFDGALNPSNGSVELTLFLGTMHVRFFLAYGILRAGFLSPLEIEAVALLEGVKVPLLLV